MTSNNTNLAPVRSDHAFMVLIPCAAYRGFSFPRPPRDDNTRHISEVIAAVMSDAARARKKREALNVR